MKIDRELTLALIGLGVGFTFVVFLIGNAVEEVKAEVETKGLKGIVSEIWEGNNEN